MKIRKPQPLKAFDRQCLTKKMVIFFDFDGVFTDNYVYVDENGIESVRCSRQDGIGLSKLKSLEVDLFVVSTENNPVVRKRCEKLDIEAHYGVKDKYRVISEILVENYDEPVVSILVGNDENDITASHAVNVTICVLDALPAFKEVADYITSKKGGRGAVREICDFLSENYWGYQK